MIGFIVRRLLIAIPTLLVVITASFFMMRAAPGSPFVSVRKLPPQVEQNLEAKYGLDRPLLEQYARYLLGVAHGDLGPSLKYPDKSVLGLIGEGLPTSATIGGLALVVGAGLGVALGVGAALQRGRLLDKLSLLAIVAGISLPSFVIAPLLVLVFASRLGWLPTGGLGDWRNFVLPVTVLALPLIAAVSRLARTGMIESLRSDAVRTARAKGLSPARIVLVHAMPPALSPLVSVLGPAAAGLLTGSLVVEQLFGLPGIGRAFVVSALQRDYTVVMGVIIVYAALIVALNLAADVLYRVLDPRVRLA